MTTTLPPYRIEDIEPKEAIDIAFTFLLGLLHGISKDEGVAGVYLKFLYNRAKEKL